MILDIIQRLAFYLKHNVFETDRIWSPKRRSLNKRQDDG
jgi:hypothetical protein